MYVDFHHNDLGQDAAAAQKALAEGIGFNDADLALNKTGKLSAPQISRLARQVLVPFGGLVITAVGLVSGGIALLTAEPATRTKLLMGLGKYMMIGIGAAFFGLLGFIVKLMLSSSRVFQFIRDMTDGKVACITGRMHASKAEGMEEGLKKSKAAFNCVVKGEYYEIEEEAYEALFERSGSNFTVYVTPRSRYLVAIEPAVADLKARDPFKLEYKT